MYFARRPGHCRGWRDLQHVCVAAYGTGRRQGIAAITAEASAER
ncbi:hypothetical protein P355_4585 [Burkholderia cenocepacia KC-01]|nr:hypothetical protein P355_4585 [Burkholderia cenocepacia KC-01]